MIVATKCGLEWDADQRQIRRNSSPDRIRQEVDDSLRRLGREWIDLYQIHWPDANTPFEDSMAALEQLRNAGKIRAIGLSNFHPDRVMHMICHHKVAPAVNEIETHPFNQQIEGDVA